MLYRGMNKVLTCVVDCLCYSTMAALSSRRPKKMREWLCRFFFSSRRRHTRLQGDWSSDVCSSDLDYADSIPLFGDAVAARPDSAELRFNLATAYAHNHDYAQAAKQYKETLRIDPHHKIGRASCRERV